MRRYIQRVVVCLAILFILAVGWIGYTHHRARLNLSDHGDRYTVEKSIGMVPASGEIHAEHVGSVDATLFYKAVVTPDEVAWLAELPEVPSFGAPSHAPFWWRLSLWWHGRSSDIKYFRKEAMFAYSKRQGVVYGVVGIE